MPQLQPFQEWVVQLVGMVSNILVGIAAIFGIFSLWQWRREMVGRTRYNLARKIVLLSENFRDEIASFRVVNSAKIIFEENLVEEDNTKDNEWNEKLDKVTKVSQELEATLLESSLLFGIEEIEAVKQLKYILLRLMFCNLIYSTTSLEIVKQEREPTENEKELLDNIRRVLTYHQIGKIDTELLQLNQIIEETEGDPLHVEDSVEKVKGEMKKYIQLG